MRGVIEMFYDQSQAIIACEEEPTLIFNLIKEGHYDIVDLLLSKKKVDINICDETGASVLVRLLKAGQYSLVLKHMKNKEWDVNKQDRDGNTFGHILVSIQNIKIMDLIKQLLKNKSFTPNIKNNLGETILDKSIGENHIYSTVKIIEDERFNSIDIASFLKLYNTYIKSNNYGMYSKFSTIQVIVDNLEDRQLVPRMSKLIEDLKNNIESIKDGLFKNSTKEIENIINNVLLESNI